MKKIRYVAIVMAVLAVCLVIGGVVDFFLHDAIDESLKGSLEQDAWRYIATISAMINWLLIGMFICVYIPSVIFALHTVLSCRSPMAILMLLPLLMVLMVSTVLWPLMCLGVIFLAPTFLE